MRTPAIDLASSPGVSPTCGAVKGAPALTRDPTGLLQHLSGVLDAQMPVGRGGGGDVGVAEQLGDDLEAEGSAHLPGDAGVARGARDVGAGASTPSAPVSTMDIVEAQGDPVIIPVVTSPGTAGPTPPGFTSDVPSAQLNPRVDATRATGASTTPGNPTGPQGQPLRSNLQAGAISLAHPAGLPVAATYGTTTALQERVSAERRPSI